MNMSTFDKREEVFEGKFAHDEEILFKILARANKLIGLWAAEKLGKSGAPPRITPIRWSPRTLRLMSKQEYWRRFSGISLPAALLSPSIRLRAILRNCVFRPRRK